MDADFLLAIQLQEQFDNEFETSVPSSDGFDDDGFGQSSKRRKVEAAGGGSGVVPRWKPSPRSERPLSIVDESWETLDPNPDVRTMFLQFNDMFFWGKLSGVEVKWSPRMTLCAGVCSYEGRGGLCSIRLSEPLLKLRPRKDLVETLLHEMIHALLFVTQNNRDRDGHGPEFCKHMNRINNASGTKITVYHSFHDEVDVYRQHWWRCNGPCQSRRPYFGYVKRAMNRAPSSLDPWWEDHQRTCGGTYTKIKEPEGYGKKNKKDGKPSEKKGRPSNTSSGFQDIRNIIPFSGKGFLLGGKPQTPSSSSTSQSEPSFKAVSSPKKPSTPASPFGNLTSPVCSDLSDRTKPGGPFTSAGGKPAVKKSVGNTRVFVNVGGSPVKIPKRQSGAGGQGAEKLKQRSIQELFNNTNLKKSAPQETKRDTLPSLKSSSFVFTKQENNHETPPSIRSETKHSAASQDGASKSTQSTRFSDSGVVVTPGAAGRGPPWDDRSSSSSIFDFFQKTLSSSSAASRESGRTQSAATSCSSSSLQSSAGLHSASSSSSSSSSSSTRMVSCPVCQTKVQDSQINEHLDSCLS
ncbi:sprT-like domain-containing protein Spartan isoform X2 [Kryptolebias marmoratus]|uniref:sprT-like domain-containing protein Spartan isoform X2 n=1 Tax=Kryptolebias marmoratus TaxID=37003 RepID=UPI0007F898C3|nr:sprT-like domain-containing protein Spartan isoform X2 [Kryptolebias marmoratus]